MGSIVEINDTLQITEEQGFPRELSLERHRQKPLTAKEFEGKTFRFHDKPGARLYHTGSTRCFLVQNIDGKWLYWGKILMLEQTISGRSSDSLTTSGKFRIIEIYDPAYQQTITRRESKEGCSYF